MVLHSDELKDDCSDTRRCGQHIVEAPHAFHELIGAVFVDVPSGFASIDNAAVRAFQAMQCTPRTALQASQWVQRSFVFPAAGVAHIRRLPAVDASPSQAGGASAPAPQRPDGTPAPRPRR